MNTRIIIYAAGSLLLALRPAQAGSRSGGTITIPADTLSSGGGTSTAGSGAGAITVTASMGGVIGTVTAASPATSNKQGFIPQILPAPVPPLTGYDLWASTNIPAGRDATFTGDWNGDGIMNGVAYVFGNTGITPTGRGRIAAPPSIPADVNVYLDRNTALSAAPGWAAITSWVNGAAPVFVSGVTLAGGEVYDTFTGPRAYYRYRVTRR